tara:strand:+ start:346 stop:534 length:189 start_codon:yes stop_codon:yes gene_type:complete
MNASFLLTGIIKQINEKRIQNEINTTWKDVNPRRNIPIKWDTRIHIGYTYHNDDYDRKVIIK